MSWEVPIKRSVNACEDKLVVDDRSPYEIARDTVTPLQQRVLDALTEEFEAPAQIAERTVKVQMSSQLREPLRYPLSVGAVKGVLPWLQAKRLAEYREGKWRRTDLEEAA